MTFRLLPVMRLGGWQYVNRCQGSKIDGVRVSEGDWLSLVRALQTTSPVELIS